jgi:acyl dehydratase
LSFSTDHRHDTSNFITISGRSAAVSIRNGDPGFRISEEIIMTLDIRCVGMTLGPVRTEYSWKDCALYALSLGAGNEDLDYVLDPQPRVLPTFSVLPAFDPVFELLRRTGGDLVTLLHSAQRTELLHPFPSCGQMDTTATITGIYDMKIGATVIIETHTRVNEILTATTVWTLLLRNAGGFGGDRPPPRLKTRPPERPADFSAEMSTAETAALLYRLNGDVNPIHSHPDIARAAGFDRPILHGLCFYGIAGRVALRHLANNDPGRFKTLECLFAKPVFPGDTLIIEGWKLDTPGTAALTVTVKETGIRAIANCLFEFAKE